jgi:hypothetical protein
MLLPEEVRSHLLNVMDQIRFLRLDLMRLLGKNTVTMKVLLLPKIEMLMQQWLNLILDRTVRVEYTIQAVLAQMLTQLIHPRCQQSKMLACNNSSVQTIRWSMISSRTWIIHMGIRVLGVKAALSHRRKQMQQLVIEEAAEILLLLQVRIYLQDKAAQAQPVHLLTMHHRARKALHVNGE